MKLSEAIRLGAMLKAQGFGRFVDGDGGSCALGAALEAVGDCAALERKGSDPDDYASAVSRWPVLARTDVDFPADEYLNTWGCGTDVLHMIWGLNDRAHWTRERVAAWIESIERTDEALSPAAGEAGTVASDALVSDAETLMPVRT